MGLEVALERGPQTWGHYLQAEAKAGILHRGLRLGFRSGDPEVAVRSPGW